MADRTLLIDRVDLPSLVALAMDSNATRLVLWHPIRDGNAQSTAERILLEQSRLFGAEAVREAIQPVDPGVGSAGASIRHAYELMQATVAAVRHGCTQVIDPIVIGPQIENLGAAVLRANAVTDLISSCRSSQSPSGPGGRDIEIDQPLIDLSDEQIVDLAEDLGAPLGACWPCGRSADAVCDQCPSCRRWQAAYAAARMDWPWATVGTR